MNNEKDKSKYLQDLLKLEKSTCSYEKGYEVWTLPNGKYHREFGPAITYPNERKEYYSYGIKISEYDFLMNRGQTPKLESLRLTLVKLDRVYPGIRKKLITWFDYDITIKELLPLPPEDNGCTDSWEYLKGVRAQVLSVMPDFESTYWIDIQV